MTRTTALPAVLGFVVVLLLSGCSGDGAPTATDESSELRGVDLVLANVAARPAEGTPEYVELFAAYAIPYVDGQSPEDVLAVAHEKRELWLTGGFADGPRNDDEYRDVMTDNLPGTHSGPSIEELVDLLDLGYYDDGAASQIYGADWRSTAPDAVAELAASHRVRLVGAYQGAIEIDLPMIVLSSTVEAATPTSIQGSTVVDFDERASHPDIVGEPISVGYELQAVDLDGDGVFDVWQVGAA